MNSLYQSAFSEALGWSLIDSLWQMGAIWLAYCIITRNGTGFSATKRHLLALLGIGSGTVLFFFSLLLNYITLVSNKSLFSFTYFIGQETAGVFSGFTLSATVVPLLSFIYIPAVLFFSLRLIFQLGLNKNIYGNFLTPPAGTVTVFINEMCERFSITKKVGVWLSEKAATPLTIGFWKPVIILPVAVFSHLSCRQVEAIIAHELFHIRRNDYFLNILLTLCEVVLFFNPFARLLSKMVRKERENSCDDQVLACGFDVWEYSQALYILGRQTNEKHPIAVAATGMGKEYLLQRIRRLMKRRNPSPSVLKPLTAFFLCLFVAGFASRQARLVPVLAEVQVAKMIIPVVYYHEEKQVIIPPPPPPSPEPVKHLPDKKIVRSHKPLLPDQEPDTPLPPEPDDIQSNFVSKPEVIEFTFIDQHVPEVPVQVTCETPMPYVPASSFYFSEIDTTGGKKIIRL